MNKSILIIEDNDDIRESTAEILQLADYTVYTANNGKRGVELALMHLPDLILCDIMMPELDGYGVLYLLGKNPQTSNIPFVFITAKAERADMRKGMEMGADDYLTKPFGDMELLNAIEIRFQKHAAISKASGDKVSLDSILDEARSEQLLTELSESSRVKTFRKKQVIYAEGDQLSHVYMVKSGSVRSYMIYQDGREIAVGLMGPGDFFGYDSVLLNSVCADNAEAVENTELYLISREEFHNLIFRNPGISKKFITLLSGNIREKQEQLMNLAYNSVRKRVADALVELAEKFAAHEESPLVKVSRDDLASMVGTANETVSRMLSDFKDEKLIERDSGGIRILSVERLRRVKQ